MESADWVMQEDTQWKFDTDSLAFALIKDDDRVVFEITRIALNDHFHTEDTKEQAIANFEGNRERVLLLARKMMSESPDQDRYMITSETCQRLGL